MATQASGNGSKKQLTPESRTQIMAALASLRTTGMQDGERVFNIARILKVSSSLLAQTLQSLGFHKRLQSKLSYEEILEVVAASTKEITDDPHTAAERFAAEHGVPLDEAAGEAADKAPAKNTESKQAAFAEAAAGDTEINGIETSGVEEASRNDRAADSATVETDSASKEATGSDDVDTADDAKLRHRVTKAVENEIHQIEDKVESELEEISKEQKLRHRVIKAVENEIHQIEEKVQEEVSAAKEKLQADDTDTLEQNDADSLPAPDADGAAAESEAVHEVLEADADIDAVAAELLSEIQVETPAADPVPQRPALPRFVAPTIPEEDDLGIDVDDEPRESEGPRRRGKRGQSRGRGENHRNESKHEQAAEAPAHFDGDDTTELIEEPKAIQGSTRLEAQRRRRQEMREESRNKRHVVSQAEFLARRESVTRSMVVCESQREDSNGSITQVGVLEDDVLVEHLVANEAQASSIGNIYLGRVQNVLPSMEAVFIDIGTGRNAVLYASDVKWREQGLHGRQRTISNAFSSGDQVLVQVTKDPLGHKGARLTTHISLAGRYLVYVPDGRNAGISRKLPEPERKRLKGILRKVVPSQGGAIIRTAAEGASEEAIATDVQRLHNLWEQIQERAEAEKNSPKAKPVTLYEEPNPLVRLIRDLFNEDFNSLIVDGKRSWNTVQAYVKSVAPDLIDRLEHYDPSAHDGRSALEKYRIDEQLQKALSRKVWLPSGGTLVIDRTEAMTVIDVNTGKFTGAKNNLEATVTQNNLEAAEEIVRQMRLRDLGGMIVVDFIDMVLPENQDLVLRRLTEALGRDRTRHQVSEVTSLGLVQITRKRLGVGLLETFSTPCPHCDGSGVLIHDYPVDFLDQQSEHHDHGVRHQNPQEHPAAVAMHKREEEPVAKGYADTEIEAQYVEPAAGQSASDKLSFEELADAVIAPVVAANNDDHNPDNREETAQENAAARKSRRRGGKSRNNRDNRKNRGDVRKADKQAATTVDIDAADALYDIVDSALSTAKQHDPDEPSGADHLPRETYEQALAAFESSPRRKRKTRGNSISDVPPKQEDYTPAQNQAQEQTSGVGNAAPTAEPIQVIRMQRSKRRRVQQAPVAEVVVTPQTHDADDASLDAPVETMTEPKAVRGQSRRRRTQQSRAENTASRKQRAAKQDKPAQGSSGKRNMQQAEQSEGAKTVPEVVPQVVQRRRRKVVTNPATGGADSQQGAKRQRAAKKTGRNDAQDSAAKASEDQRTEAKSTGAKSARAQGTEANNAQRRSSQARRRRRVSNAAKSTDGSQGDGSKESVKDTASKPERAKNVQNRGSQAVAPRRRNRRRAARR
ncbi:MAG: Rne/Rng family ribonuclease [Corynebacterium sp.]|nr:Rne/Rng family ribonuclease [Corynebacterium sp.]